MTPAIDRKTRRLLTQLAALEGVLDGTLVALCPDKIRRDLFVSARELREEMNKPLKITPWRPDAGRGV